MEHLLELKIDENTHRVLNRESEHREFKASFDNNSLWKYAKTMAAFANRDGGVIFFGIKDRPRELLGVTGNQPDELVFANFLKEYFEPEITFELDSRQYNGKTLLFAVVQSSLAKPIICKKKKIQKSKEQGKSDKEVLREGAIYYRYSSASTEINFPELRQILDERVQKVFHSLVENITLINKVGFDKAAVVDAENLTGDDKTTSVYVTNETAKNINWIGKGRFTESEDAEKAFYVTREIEVRHGVEIEKPVDPGTTHTLTKTSLTKEVSIKAYIEAVLWKLGLLDNPKYHLSGNHGKNRWHKFTEATKGIILDKYPKDLANRADVIRKINDEYNNSKKTTVKVKVV